jgi:Ca2+-binding EF-hand superfamily protein
MQAPSQDEKVKYAELKKLMAKYDTDKSGSLDAEQLTQLLAHHDNGCKSEWDEYHMNRVIKSIGSVTPTSEEIALLLKAAAKVRQNSVDVSEINFVLDLWHSYVMNRTEIEAVFEKFDTNHSQKLEFDQLKGYLTELNEGQAPKVTPCTETASLSILFDMIETKEGTRTAAT